jgi:hypothetical protein
MLVTARVEAHRRTASAARLGGAGYGYPAALGRHGTAWHGMAGQTSSTAQLILRRSHRGKPWSVLYLYYLYLEGNRGLLTIYLIYFVVCPLFIFHLFRGLPAIYKGEMICRLNCFVIQRLTGLTRMR